MIQAPRLQCLLRLAKTIKTQKLQNTEDKSFQNTAWFRYRKRRTIISAFTFNGLKRLLTAHFFDNFTTYRIAPVRHFPATSRRPTGPAQNYFEQRGRGQLKQTATSTAFLFSGAVHHHRKHRASILSSATTSIPAAHQETPLPRNQ